MTVPPTRPSLQKQLMICPAFRRTRRRVKTISSTRTHKLTQSNAKPETSAAALIQLRERRTPDRIVVNAVAQPGHLFHNIMVQGCWWLLLRCRRCARGHWLRHPCLLLRSQSPHATSSSRLRVCGPSLVEGSDQSIRRRLRSSLSLSGSRVSIYRRVQLLI
ncbi:hypothetical protein Mapa_012848 [Marchantia paleacea]|nr:hypothetical protein Mapa_012848 [Marchantia paleacea]